jgi:hypothetical protein
MSTFFADCPLPTELVCIPPQNCPVKWGQIQKMAFQRRAGVAAFDTMNVITAQASWVAAMAAGGAGRVIVSPFINNFVIPNGEVTYDGGDTNETLNGVAIYKGNAPVTVTGFLANASPEVVKTFRKLSVFSQATGLSDLEAFLFNERGDIICRNLGTEAAPEYRGIPIYNLGVGTVGTAGLGANNQNNISFQLVGAWDENLATVQTNGIMPAWSPLELENICA